MPTFLGDNVSSRVSGITSSNLPITIPPYIAASLSINSTPVGHNSRWFGCKAVPGKSYSYGKKDGVFCDPKNRAETLTLTGKKESGSWKWSSGLLFFGRFLELFLQEESHVCNEYFTKKTVYHHSISPWGGDVKTTWKQPPKRTSFGNPGGPNKKWGTLGFI